MSVNFDLPQISSRDKSKKVQTALVIFLYNQAKISFISSFFCATVLLLGLIKPSHNTLLYCWYGAFIAITFLRTILIHYFHTDKSPSRRLKLWRNSYIVGSVVSGLCWGTVGGVLYPHDSVLKQMLVNLILSGLAAGSVPTLSSNLLASVAYLLTILTPLIATLLTLQNKIYYLYDLTVFSYLIFLVALAYKSNKMIHTAIGLQFEKEALLDELSQAKTALEAINKQLEHTATHDPLTNLESRNLFTEKLENALKRAKQNNTKMGLLYLDLDNFKVINDNYGHQVGDKLLLAFSQKLCKLSSGKYPISRLGGDEFTIIIEDISGVETITQVVKNIFHALKEPVNINGFDIKINSSIGISMYPQDATDAETLMSIADKNMYRIKRNGGNNFSFNNPILA